MAKDKFDPKEELANIQSALEAIPDVQMTNKIDYFAKADVIIKELKKLFEEVYGLVQEIEIYSLAVVDVAKKMEKNSEEKKVLEQESELKISLQKALSTNQQTQKYLIKYLSAERILEDGKWDTLAKHLAHLIDIADQKLQQGDSSIAQTDHKIKELQEKKSHAVEHFIKDFKAFLSALPIPQFECDGEGQDYKVHLEQAFNLILDRFQHDQSLAKDLQSHLLIAKSKFDHNFVAATNRSTSQKAQMLSSLKSATDDFSSHVANNSNLTIIKKVDQDIMKNNKLLLVDKQERDQFASDSVDLKKVSALFKQIEENPAKFDELMYKVTELLRGGSSTAMPLKL